MLQVLDDGRLTDGQGRTVDFRNVILILTSNTGSQYLIDMTIPFPLQRRTDFQPVEGLSINKSFRFIY